MQNGEDEFPEWNQGFRGGMADEGIDIGKFAGWPPRLRGEGEGLLKGRVAGYPAATRKQRVIHSRMASQSGRSQSP